LVCGTAAEEEGLLRVELPIEQNLGALLLSQDEGDYLAKPYGRVGIALNMSLVVSSSVWAGAVAPLLNPPLRR
jgi:hypothetical protein